MLFQFRGDELSRRVRPNGVKFSIFACSKQGKCTERDVGQKQSDGSPMAVCATCPLLAECRVAEPEKEKPFNSGIGTKLKAIIERNAGAMPCGECKEEIRRLNTLTVGEVLADRDSLVDRIVSRAQEKAPKWWQRWGATVAPSIARGMVLGWINEALMPTEQQQ